jgi:hypothetical protein
MNKLILQTLSAVCAVSSEIDSTLSISACKNVTSVFVLISAEERKGEEWQE